jgi:hypothetical protein
MTTTRTDIRCAVRETEEGITIELELPEGIEIDRDRVSIAQSGGSVELRLPTAQTFEQAVEPGLRGFHPDAPPS